MSRTPDIRALRSFVAVARAGNVSRAAEAVNLTQPAVSLQLRKLSEESGLTLFRRTPRGVEMTREGAALLAKAEQVLTALDEFGQTARWMNGTVRGTLRIGTILDPDFTRLGQFLAGLVDRYPDLKTELLHGMSGDVPERILRNRIDAGFFLGEFDDTAAAKAELCKRPLTRFTYSVIAPAGWERRVMGADWPTLAALPWIGTPDASVHHRLLSTLLARYGVEQNIVSLVDQEPSMLAMVRSGVGLSLCRESIALQESYAQGIVIADRVQVDTDLSFVTLKARRNDPNIEAAFDVLQSIWPSLE